MFDLFKKEHKSVAHPLLISFAELVKAKSLSDFNWNNQVGNRYVAYVPKTMFLREIKKSFWRRPEWQLTFKLSTTTECNILLSGNPANDAAIEGIFLSIDHKLNESIIQKIADYKNESSTK